MDLFTYIVEIAGLASVLATFLGLVFSVASGRISVSKLLSERDKNQQVVWTTHDSALSSSAIARSQVTLRLNEAKNAMEQQKSAAKVSKWAANFLTFGQYVIGGVLASSFVQESLSPKAVGFFGVLVLVASLVKQQYHPEVNAAESKQAALKLQALIRHSEDQLAALDATSTKGEDRTDALISLTNQISRRLNEIENAAATTSSAVGNAATGK